MFGSYSSLVLGAMIVNFAARSQSRAAEEATGNSKPCRLWIGPSHLSEDSSVRFGFFAGVDFSENDLLPNPEIAIPLIDVTDVLYSDHDNYPLIQKLIRYLESLVWLAGYGAAQWEGNHTTTLFIPGIGALASEHPGSSNVDWLQASALVRNTGNELHPAGKSDPSRGAITTYSNFTFRATQSIPAGSELFPSYSDNFESQVHEDIHQERVTRLDYANADKVVDKILEFMDTHQDKVADADLRQRIVDFMLEQILDGAGGKRAKVVRSLIPPSVDKMRKVKARGGTFKYRNQDLVKSQRWLEKHGVCVDKLRSGISSIPYAGRGAFASRPLKAGEVIAPVPMVTIVAEDLLEMYEILETKNRRNATEFAYDRSKPIGHQILLNYCFGHMESSLLLLPASPMVNLVNHGSKAKKQANAELVWSDHNFVGNDQSLHDRSFLRWKLDESFPNVVMNLVALRDIEEEEEVLIDYGPAWEEAWEEHLAKWSKTHPVDEEVHRSALDVRAKYKDEPYPVDLKMGANPYPPGVVTGCFIDVVDPPDGTPQRNDKDQQIMIWNGPRTYEEYTGDKLGVCDLISREVSLQFGYTYTVLSKFRDSKGLVQVNDVPHAAITLLDRPYKGDIHTPDAFRQWIAIEDVKFPQAWRNLREYS